MSWESAGSTSRSVSPCVCSFSGSGSGSFRIQWKQFQQQLMSVHRDDVRQLTMMTSSDPAAAAPSVMSVPSWSAVRSMLFPSGKILCGRTTNRKSIGQYQKMVWVVLVDGCLHGVYSCAVDAHLQAKPCDGTVTDCPMNSEVGATKSFLEINDALDSGVHRR